MKWMSIPHRTMSSLARNGMKWVREHRCYFMKNNFNNLHGYIPSQLDLIMFYHCNKGARALDQGATELSPSPQKYSLYLHYLQVTFRSKPAQNTCCRFTC